MTDGASGASALWEARPTRTWGALLVGLALAAGTFVFDLTRPGGVAAAVPYVAVVLAGLVSQRRDAVIGFALLTSVLTAAGYFLSPGSGDPRLELANRGLAIFAIWSVAATAIGYLASQKKFERELSALATEDPLTGLPNRRYILDQLFRQIRVAERYDQPFSIALLDVDNFKEFNDRFGHQVGDEILRQASRLAASCIRDSDEIGRYGGEEFLVLLPSTRLHQAEAMGHRIGQEIADFELWRQGVRLSITVSVGIAECPPEGIEVETLLRHADEALYKAKREGRNRVVCYDEATVSGTLELSNRDNAAV